MSLEKKSTVISVRPTGYSKSNSPVFLWKVATLRIPRLDKKTLCLSIASEGLWGEIADFNSNLSDTYYKCPVFVLSLWWGISLPDSFHVHLSRCSCNDREWVDYIEVGEETFYSTRKSSGPRQLNPFSLLEGSLYYVLIQKQDFAGGTSFWQMTLPELLLLWKSLGSLSPVLLESFDVGLYSLLWSSKSKLFMIIYCVSVTKCFKEKEQGMSVSSPLELWGPHTDVPAPYLHPWLQS